MTNKSGQRKNHENLRMWRLNPEYFEGAAEESVKKELRNFGWPVYEDYEVRDEDGETFVVAPVSLASFAEPEPTQDRVVQGYRVRSFAGRSPSQDAMTFYAPLRTPELVLELAELAEKEITPEAVLGWAQVYGLMGFPDEDTVTVDEGFAKFKIERLGRRESLRSFAQAAGEIRGCLRLYEAITADEDLEMGDLRPVANLLPPKAFAPFGPVERHVGKERPWLYRVLARMIQMRLDQYCHPQFVAHTQDGVATGRFSLV